MRIRHDDARFCRGLQAVSACAPDRALSPPAAPVRLAAVTQVTQRQPRLHRIDLAPSHTARRDRAGRDEIALPPEIRLPPALWHALGALAPRAPVAILIHGFGYSPFRPGRLDQNPHSAIFANNPASSPRRVISWPRHLGFGPDARSEGLAVALGWHARGHLWQAWREADAAGQALAQLVMAISQARGGAPVDLIGHSLGARVALSALCALREPVAGRVVLLAGAEFQSRAEAAAASPGASAAQILNITTRENDFFDWLTELAIRAPRRGDQALGSGLSRALPNWLDLQIDDPATREHLARLGHVLPPPRGAICHWSPYLRPGAMRLYRRFVHDRAALTLETLRAGLPVRTAPRWSRLRAHLARQAGPDAALTA